MSDVIQISAIRQPIPIRVTDRCAGPVIVTAEPSAPEKISVDDQEPITLSLAPRNPLCIRMAERVINGGGGCPCPASCYCHIEDADYNERGELVMQVWTHGKDPHVGCEILEAAFNANGELICVCGIYGAIWPDQVGMSNVSVDVYHDGQYDLGTYYLATTDIGDDRVTSTPLDVIAIYGVFSLGSYSPALTEELRDTVAMSNVSMIKDGENE